MKTYAFTIPTSKFRARQRLVMRIQLVLATSLVAGVFALLCQVLACGMFSAPPTDPTRVDTGLSDCRAVGRTSHEAGASEDLAYKAYEDCTKDAGFRK